MITESQLLTNAIQQQWLDPARLVDDLLVIDRADQRNCNFHIRGRQGRNLFVKQAQGQVGIGTMSNEAQIYQTLSELPAMQELLPSFIGYDRQRDLLCIESLSDAMDLREYHFGTSRFPAYIARMLGRQLATLHRETRHLAQTESPGDPLFPMFPSVFQLGCPPADIMRRVSAVGLELMKMFRRHPILPEAFERLRMRWQCDAIIHGDIKPANFMRYGAGPSRPPKVKLIDWEFAGRGDSRWDIASVLAGYLNCWIISIPMTGRRPVFELAADAQFSLSAIQSFLRTFWRSYIRHSYWTVVEANQQLETIVQLAGARLVKTAYEFSQATNEMTPQIATLMQVSINILGQPREAQSQLFGIESTSKNEELK